MGLCRFHFFMLVPLVLLDQHDYEILRNHSNYLASNIYNRKRIHALLSHLVKSLDCTNTLQDFQLIVHRESFSNNVSDPHEPSFAGHVVSQYW